MWGISIREFARRDGCSDTLVRRALKTGHLRAAEDGSLDPGLVGTGWRDANRRAANTAKGSRGPPVGILDGETPAEAAERIVTAAALTDGLLEIADAERLKENYLGRLKQLEYDTKAAAVATVGETLAAVAVEYAKVRTRLLAIPSELAPRVHHLKTLPEIQAVLTAAIVEALEELTRDGAPAAR